MSLSSKKKEASVIKKLARNSLKTKKNYIAIMGIILATLLFMSVFTIVASLQMAMQESSMRKIGMSAHAGIKHITLNEYEELEKNNAISKVGHSIIIGSAVGDIFNKIPTEIRWADKNYAEWTFNTPTKGRLPEEENELATSRIVLDAMGIPAEIGRQIKINYITDSASKTDTFTLCGVWEGDIVAHRQTILLSKKYTDKVTPIIKGQSDAIVTASTGYIDCIMMFPTSWNIEKQALELTKPYGLSERISINTAYSTAQISIGNIAIILSAILIILLASYLLIYNIFYISIAQDICFYGMLKTLGATSKQISRIVYKKAMRLSLVGIPIGLIIGWPTGQVLVPSIIRIMGEDMRIVNTVNPNIFIVATILALVTVFISCHKPAKLAMSVSPIEALKYVEQSSHQKKVKASKYITPLMLARENLGRNKKKVMIVTFSFALSITLLNSVYTCVRSFDFDKFTQDISITDFSVSDTTIINSNSPFNTANVNKEFVKKIENLEGLERIGNVYLRVDTQPFDDMALRQFNKLAEGSEAVAAEYDNYLVRKESVVSTYGIDEWMANYLQVIEGDLKIEEWKAGNGIYVTKLRMVGNGMLSLYHPGDQVIVKCKDGSRKSYQVLAIVDFPAAYRAPMSLDLGLEYILNTNQFQHDFGSMLPMRTIFDVTDTYTEDTENWLENYTTNIDTSLGYWSKNTLRGTFKDMINMYKLIGGTLCVILALVGTLNFINSMITSILSRKKEIAMLQSIGMTGSQVRRMLIFEGVGYAMLGIICALIFSVVISSTIVRGMGNELPYFSWHFTLIPVEMCVIPLLAITILVPWLCYKKMTQKTVVERLRERT